MKRFSLLSMISVVILSVLSISCSKDDDVTPENETVTDGAVADTSTTGNNDSDSTSNGGSDSDSTSNGGSDSDSTNNNSNDPDSTINVIPPEIKLVGVSEVNGATEIGGESISFEIITSNGDLDLDQIVFRENGAALAEGRIIIDGNEISSSNSVYTVPNSESSGATYTISIVPNTIVGTESIQIAVVDNDGLVGSLTVTLTTEEAVSTDLNTAENFTFMRAGFDAAVGLDQFGLSWSSNNSSGMVVIEPNANVTLVQLADEASDNITTVEGLSEAIDNATSITEYTGVSSLMNGTYTDVLGVENNGVYYLIRITDGASEVGNAGTDITINGWSRSSL